MKFFLQTLILTIAVFISAFLLFMVQPMFARLVLPALGGSAAVWTSVMLFFQALLLAGYVYSHVCTSFLGMRSQIAVHGVLVLSAVLLLSFSINEQEASPESPVPWLLYSALTTVGWPFFVLSASAPLLQRWFTYTSHPRRGNPYFLYAASNAGSMCALLGYPFLIERFFDLGRQQELWGFMYLVLVLFFFISGALVMINRNGTLEVLREKETAVITPWSRFVWVLFSFIPSSLMLGLTSYVTTDIAAVSLFWVIPLALYLASFIIVFGGSGDFGRKFYLTAIFSLLGVVMASFAFTGHSKVLAILSNTILFFILALYFHGELARYKPHPSLLTRFYIWIAVGGMMGGIFNAIIAPLVFNQSLEYLLVLFYSLIIFILGGQFRDLRSALFVKKAVIRFIVCISLLLIIDQIITQAVTPSLLYRLWGVLAVFGLIVVLFYFTSRIKRWELVLNLLILIFFAAAIPFISHDVIISKRSFYGTMRVNREQYGDAVIHAFTHGTTVHGSQIIYPESRQKEIIAYFHPAGAFGDIARGYIESSEHELTIGILGLGSGALSCYARENDSVVYFEIDKKVEDIARDSRYFTFLEHCPADVQIGDGRILLRGEPDRKFDLLYMDAFSSDSVPVHLLTQEAILLYLEKITEDGAIIIHISNRYLDLKKVVSGYELPDDYAAYYSDRGEVDAEFYSPQTLVVIGKRSSMPESVKSNKYWNEMKRDPAFRTWTDTYTNIVNILIPPWRKPDMPPPFQQP